MEKLKEGFTVCGGQICHLRYSLAVNSALVFLFISLPIGGFIRLYPEFLGFIDIRVIFFLFPALVQFLFWGLGAGCHLCLFSYVDSEMEKLEGSPNP